jgi:hypothetical protein
VGPFWNDGDIVVAGVDAEFDIDDVKGLAAVNANFRG